MTIHGNDKKTRGLGGSPPCMVVALLCAGLFSAPLAVHAREGGKIYVVSTLTDYAAIAREIGGDKVKVEAIAKGDEDSHFVLPKPSYADRLSRADLFLTTGLDLELWAPSVIDKSQNGLIREGQVGYVAVSDGIAMLEIPKIVDRGQGGVHVYGNPHVHTSPINAKVIATNIAIGLKKVDSKNEAYYAAGLKKFKNAIDERLYGKELVALLGGKTLDRLAQSGNLISFLEGKEVGGAKLIEKLGGWMQEMRPLRGKKLVTYHKNWIYFSQLFGIDVIGEVEPKPSIPPSPGDVERLIENMKRLDVKVVLAANFYDENKVKMICRSVGAKPIIVPLSVEGTPQVKNYFQLVDTWVNSLRTGYGIR
ncbi:MAG: metal ABC transporter substrate-binding protein [Myxococcota bacterium]|jgi:ABC-type Zn uptake system ZnuABC Zn-binding protein ZnuA|nr:metal ABC transporter substrate-binding protein [Myxococcota bacterium]